MQSNQPEPVKADWIVSLLGRVKALEVNPHEEALTSILVEQALENAKRTVTNPGISLAAAFDLIVPAEYYTKLTNKAILYCPINNIPLLVAERTLVVFAYLYLLIILNLNYLGYYPTQMLLRLLLTWQKQSSAVNFLIGSLSINTLK